MREKIKNKQASIKKIELEIERRNRIEEENEKSVIKAKEVIETKNLIEEMKKMIYRKNTEEYERRKLKGKKLRDIYDEIYNEKAKAEVSKAQFF